MPIISQFYGILIYIYKEIGGHHNKPHIHAKYNEYEASIIIENSEWNGDMPSKQKKIIVFHYLPKKRSHKKQGHRQPYTKLVITKINA